MRKWIMLAVFNWLRKPANRQKAKNAWNKYRGNNTQRTGQNPNRPGNGSARNPDDIDGRF
ncbi:hypothetical protein [Vreelandella sp. EE22]